MNINIQFSNIKITVTQTQIITREQMKHKIEFIRKLNKMNLIPKLQTNTLMTRQE